MSQHFDISTPQGVKQLQAALTGDVDRKAYIGKHFLVTNWQGHLYLVNKVPERGRNRNFLITHVLYVLLHSLGIHEGSSPGANFRVLAGGQTVRSQIIAEISHKNMDPEIRWVYGKRRGERRWWSFRSLKELRMGGRNGTRH